MSELKPKRELVFELPTVVGEILRVYRESTESPQVARFVLEGTVPVPVPPHLLDREREQMLLSMVTSVAIEVARRQKLERLAADLLRARDAHGARLALAALGRRQ